jgi:pilus assembly protein CpaC
LRRAALLLVLCGAGAQAKPPPGGAAPLPSNRVLQLEAGGGQVVATTAAVANIFVADPKIVEVRPASSASLFIFGVAAGRTVVAIMNAAGGVISQYDVTVRPSSFGARETTGQINRFAPGQVNTTPTPAGLTLGGRVATPSDAERSEGTAQAFLLDKQTVDNRLRVASSIQVSLRVRVAEMSRTLTRELGLNWTALADLGKNAMIGITTTNPLAVSATTLVSGAYTGGGVGKTIDLNAVIDALAQDNLVHVLAEPNLTAISGEPASFLVGGEFPIPIAQSTTNGASTTTVVFKQYGVSLSFVPTVLSDGRINLHVRPEVSQLTTAGAVSVATGTVSISIPALTVRRVDTTVELGSGQSFAIAGLLQESTTLTDNGVPFLGDVPILGALFRSDSFQRSETELVILVTPYIVQPASGPSAIALPTDGWTPPNDLQRILLLRQKGTPAPSPVLQGPQQAGFIVQ